MVRNLGNVITSTYSDGEFQPSYEESIRGHRIFILVLPILVQKI